ncbi:hypothetical protein [Microbulbifer rhizosphaerae]|uniref:Uncharacterized protein n=1 Tax=Microbulbifer rhizosphaerae TaxID=1562603 RepID=A0A7W4Z7C1_9GAMM|nr:hypothetical protein [Microbulbifer rhizosphaerae]MBB3059578.1 hypothetical protein [Microbulbifer rhizosphaerae]
MQYEKNPLFLLVSLCSLYAHADQWFFEKELKEDRFKFDDIVIKRIRDTRENQSYPVFRLVVSDEEKEIANFKNLTFDKISSFERGNYFLGVSNSGLSTFAFIILDKYGNLLRAENHSKNMSYCRMSVTLEREWVNLENLDIKEEYETIENEFYPENPYVFLKSVSVNGCDGNRVEVWTTSI